MCDLDDGYIPIDVSDAASISWQLESAFQSFNLYRSDIGYLKSTGIITQDSSIVSLATAICGISGSSTVDAVSLSLGEAVVYFVTGIDVMNQESSLGSDGEGVERPHDNPCP